MAGKIATWTDVSAKGYGTNSTEGLTKLVSKSKAVGFGCILTSDGEGYADSRLIPKDYILSTDSIMNFNFIPSISSIENIYIYPTREPIDNANDIINYGAMPNTLGNQYTIEGDYENVSSSQYFTITKVDDSVTWGTGKEWLPYSSEDSSLRHVSIPILSWYFLGEGPLGSIQMLNVEITVFVSKYRIFSSDGSDIPDDIQRHFELQINRMSNTVNLGISNFPNFINLSSIINYPQYLAFLMSNISYYLEIQRISTTMKIKEAMVIPISTYSLRKPEMEYEISSINSSTGEIIVNPLFFREVEIPKELLEAEPEYVDVFNGLGEIVGQAELRSLPGEIIEE